MSAAYPRPSTTNSRLGPHRKHTKHDLCPVCKKGTSHCITFADGATICGKTPNPHPAGIGYMHWPNGLPVDWREQIATLPKPAPRPTVDADLAHRVYEAVLVRCPLSPAHIRKLQERGLSDEQISRHGYATAPRTQAARLALAAEVAAEIGQELAGVVPGFIRDKQGRLDLVCGGGEQFIPIRDVHERIAGIRRRLDDSEDGTKYKWLSLTAEGSVGVDGHTVHVARPAILRTDRVLIVEGEFKANIAADFFGCIVISVPGVSNINRVAATLAELNVTEVAIAYDSDAKTNPHVATAETKLAHILIAAGYAVAQWTWGTEEAKGLDELLAAGLWPFPIPHPALTQETPAHDATPELAEVRRLHSLSNAARRSPNLGAERHTLTDFATMLSNQPEGEWVSAPYSKIGDQAGVDARTAERQLAKAGIRPKERAAGVLAGLVEVELREVPERVNEQTGQVTGGYKAVHVRRLAALPDMLHRIATAPAPASGKRNNYGGKRECPKCGSTTIERTVTDRCVCGEFIKQTTRTIANDEDDTPGRQLDAHPSEIETVADISASTVTVLRGDNLPPTPPRQLDVHPPDRRDDAETRGLDAEEGIAQRARHLTRERRAQAYASLVALHELTPSNDADDQPDESPGDEVGEPPPLMLFPLPDAGCEGCGAAVAEGRRYCRNCDPRTA